MLQLFLTPPNDFKAKIKVVVCFIEHGNEVLFVKRSKNVSLPGTWSIPGGKVDDGEDLEQAVVREIYEECGIALNRVTYVETIYIRNPDFDYDFTMFRHTLDEKPEIVLDLFENDEYEWLSRSQVMSLDQQNLLIPKEMECIALVYGQNEFGTVISEFSAMNNLA